MAISELPEDEAKEQLTDAIVSISCITGHSLPEDPVIAYRLIRDVLSQFISFGYETLTAGEIVLAFRLNCVCGLKYPSGSEVERVQIFGRHISVDYITRVVNTYVSLRNIFDNQLKNIIDGYK